MFSQTTPQINNYKLSNCYKKYFNWLVTIFDTIFKDSQTHLWKYSENFLYYEYQKHFDWVKPYLDRIKAEALQTAGKTWGRLSTLAYLSGHLTENQLFNDFSTLNKKACLGITQVFCANIGDSKLSHLCEQGILRILQIKAIPKEVLDEIDFMFKKLNQHENNLAYSFINAFPDEQELWKHYHFFDWIADYSNFDPISALSLCEKLLDKIEQSEHQSHIWRTEPLVSAAIRILQEADDMDEPEIIHRAIVLQDRLLKLDSQDMMKALDELARDT